MMVKIMICGILLQSRGSNHITPAHSSNSYIRISCLPDQYQNINAGAVGVGVGAAAGTSFPPLFTGLPDAKKRILIAIAKPAWRQTTRISNALLVCLSVALSTGYRFRSRNATLSPKPTPTKTKLRMAIGDQEIKATGIQMRFE